MSRMALILATLLLSLPRDPPIPAPPPARQCYRSLCGENDEKSCFCHYVGGLRCWTLSVDCELDRECCLADGGCAGMNRDRCAVGTWLVKLGREARDAGTDAGK